MPTPTEEEADDYLFAKRSYPWWKTHLQWPLRRFWDEWSPRMLCRKARWFIQRGSRGWSDRDIWSLADYVAEWMPAALRRLKQDKQGIPMAMFTEAELDRMQNGNSEVDNAAASQRWTETLDKMIAGFEAYNRMSDGLYKPELGPYPPIRSPEAKTRLEQSQQLTARDQKIWEEGAALFIKHFGSLWD